MVPPPAMDGGVGAGTDAGGRTVETECSAAVSGRVGAVGSLAVGPVDEVVRVSPAVAGGRPV
ncbi:MAG: hypothetical protein ACK5PP_03630, partial [Acidimicrobiales bacterium]